MHYGVLSDIHGDLASLKSVWGALAELGLTDRPVFNAGDNVGYGDAPEACVQFLRFHPNILTVQGNYDKNVAQFVEREAEFHQKWGKSRPEKFQALQRDSRAISDETRAWLFSLPKELELSVEGSSILMTHYSPGGKEGLGRWTSDRRLGEIAADTDAAVVLCGHTHTPFVRSVGGVLFVNPGTVGRSWSDQPSYAVLTLEPGHPPTAHLKSAPSPPIMGE